MNSEITPSVDRAIGRIEAKIDGVLIDQAQSRADRKENYKRMEAIERGQERTAETLKAIDERLAAVEAPVSDFNRWRERAVGAIMLVSLVAASIGGLIVSFGKKLWALVAG